MLSGVAARGEAAEEVIHDHIYLLYFAVHCCGTILCRRNGCEEKNYIEALQTDWILER